MRARLDHCGCRSRARALLGVLSIIRLRSSEISPRPRSPTTSPPWAIGRPAGLTTTPSIPAIALMILVVAVLAVADHPRLFAGYRQQTIAVDVAHSDEDVLRSHLEMLLGGTVVNLSVVRLDLVNDTTLVDVRYRVPRSVTGRTDDDAPTEPAMIGRDRVVR